MVAWGASDHLGIQYSAGGLHTPSAAHTLSAAAGFAHQCTFHEQKITCECKGWQSQAQQLLLSLHATGTQSYLS